MEINSNDRFKRFYVSIFSPSAVIAERFEAVDELPQQGIFDFGELTRIVTTVIFLRLCSEKHVSLSRYVGEYLNHFSCWGKERVQLWELLSGSKIVSKFSPAQHLEGLDLRLRPGLIKSKVGKKSIFFEVCRLALERDKSGTDHLNFLILEYLCEMLSCSTLEKLTHELASLSGCSGGFGFIDFSRVSKFARDSLNTEFIQDMLERKHPAILHECVNLGGITGFYGLVGKPSAFVCFLQKFLANLHNPGPFIQDPILRVSKTYLPENQVLFFKQIDNCFIFTDVVGNSFAFDITQSDPLGALILVESTSQPTRDEIKMLQRLALDSIRNTGK